MHSITLESLCETDGKKLLKHYKQSTDIKDLKFQVVEVRYHIDKYANYNPKRTRLYEEEFNTEVGLVKIRFYPDMPYDFIFIIPDIEMP
jgi:hypothetical protein